MGNLTTSCLIIAMLGVVIGLFYASQIKQPFQIEVSDKTSGKNFEFMSIGLISNEDYPTIESNLLNMYIEISVVLLFDEKLQLKHIRSFELL